MKTLTICGSMRFSNEMHQIAWELETMHGFNILQCVYGDESFSRDGLRGWYKIYSFYVENEYGTRFLFDTYGSKWLVLNRNYNERRAPQRILCKRFSTKSRISRFQCAG